MKRDLIHKISDITGISDLKVRYLNEHAFKVSACGNYQEKGLMIVLSNYGEKLAEDDRYIINVGEDIVLEFDNDLDQAIGEFAKLVHAMHKGDLMIKLPRKFGPVRVGGEVSIK